MVEATGSATWVHNPHLRKWYPPSCNRPFGTGDSDRVAATADGIYANTGRNGVWYCTLKKVGELPAVRLRSEPYENTPVVEVKDRQDCELAAFDLATGKLLYKVSGQGAGEFGEYGRVSATVQQGCTALLGKSTLTLSRTPP